MKIDYATLLLTTSCTIAAFGVLCLLLARAEPILAPLRLMAFGNFLFAIGTPLLLLRGGSYNALGVVLGNGALLAGWGMQVAAARSFGGRPPWLWLPAGVAFGWAAFCLLPGVMEDFDLRVALASGTAALLAGTFTWQLTRLWTGWRLGRLLIGLLCGLHPLLLVLRVAGFGLWGGDAVHPSQPVLVLSGILGIIACTLFLVTEAMRRAGQEVQADLAAAHAEAAESRDLLAQVIENLPAVIYVNRLRPDLSWTRSFLSANTQRAIGWPRGELGADDSLETRTEWTPAERRAVMLELTTQGQVVVEVPMRLPDGKRFWARRQSRIARRHADGSVDVVGYLVDITGERNLTAQMQASAKLATLGEMATGLAHELGQPAATMCLAAANAARALRSRGEAAIPDALRRLDRIIGQGERMGALMQHLKAFARADPIMLGPVVVAQAVEGALVLTAAGLRQEEIALEQEIDADLPLVQAQLVPLEQVLMNLLLNARDAIRLLPAGAPRRIRLRAVRAGESQVAIEVADTGGGLDAAILPRLFEPFVTTKPVGEGLGLGLSVSHGLVRGMGGTITARNGPEGAVFTVTLACAAALVPA
jgi:signal transduction histidine kinase